MVLAAHVPARHPTGDAIPDFGAKPSPRKMTRDRGAQDCDRRDGDQAEINDEKTSLIAVLPALDFTA